MDIKTYLSGAERGAATALAKALGVSPVMVSQWAAGVKPVPAERASEIELATGASVRRWDLRPDDWHRIWPELIAAPGAPAVPERALIVNPEAPAASQAA